MTDHHDFGYDDGHHFDEVHHFDDVQPEPLSPEDHLAFDDVGHDDPVHVEAGHAAVDEPHETLPVPEQQHVAEISDMPEMAVTPDDVFPPAVDVGQLPEPVDGFPWIDSGSLGLADIQAALHEADATDPVHPRELAEYAGTELPPGEDPWAALADSDDPATAALAKWWQQN